ncbi:hypothetical protein [Yinghuangia seranimata]|nr:hypothetical protein [Yinghuangia seranimata]MDI2128658.1 hypothetical protein [Yinghuangia seranimata]
MTHDQGHRPRPGAPRVTWAVRTRPGYPVPLAAVPCAREVTAIAPPTRY